MLADADEHAIRARLLALVAKEGLVAADQLKPEMKLDELGLKSADLMMILMAIEEEFKAYIPVDDSLTNAETLDDLLRALTPHLTAKA